MPSPASPSGVAEISAPLGRGVRPADSVALGDGQLRHAQTAARASVAEEASTVCVPLHSDQFQLAELGGALVQRIERQSNQARQLRKCAGSKTGDRGIPAKLERKSEALHLDGHRRGHHDENRAGAGQDGADPARIHPAPQQEKERNSLYSYLRYTPLGFITEQWREGGYFIYFKSGQSFCETRGSSEEPSFLSFVRLPR